MIVFKPIQDRHLVKQEQAEDKTSGGLFIPEVGKEVPARGYVIASGDGKRFPDGSHAPNIVRPGDKVMYGRYAGSAVKIDNEAYLILREDEILGTYAEYNAELKGVTDAEGAIVDAEMPPGEKP